MTDFPIGRLPDPATVAESVFQRARVIRPPVDLERVLSLWPNLSVTEEEISGAGYLLPIGELGGTILVKSRDGEERKRFTIAHELGHWVLGLSLKEKFGRFSQPKDVPYAAIERWCDLFATNLLMPESLIRTYITGSNPVLIMESVVHAASKFKVSEQALFIRMWEVLKIQVAFVTLAGEFGRQVAQVERSYAERNAETALDRALKNHDVLNQLTMLPIVYLSLSSPEGTIKCFGRRLSADRLLLVLKWPAQQSDISSTGV